MSDQRGSDLKSALADALDDLEEGLGGTVDEADLVDRIGATTSEHIVEASDLRGPDQTDAYLVLCDLLASRRANGIDQILGCLVFQTEPDAEALVPALTAMNGAQGFTPVLPLSSEQAADLAATDFEIEAFITNAVSLLGVAVDHHQPDRGHAATFLGEIDDLIETNRAG